MAPLRISRFVAQEQPAVISGSAEGDAIQKMIAWLIALPEARRARILIQPTLLDEYDGIVDASPIEFLTDANGDALDKALTWLNGLPARLAAEAVAAPVEDAPKDAG